MAKPSAAAGKWRSLVLLSRSLSVAVACLLLSACLIMSGEETTLDRQQGSASLATSFVGAEGQSQRELELGIPDSTVQVIALVGVESGDLELSLIGPDGAVVFSVAARPDTQITRSGSVKTDVRGNIRYSVNARGARNGSYQLFAQP